jgi:hypothetical protein
MTTGRSQSFPSTQTLVESVWFIGRLSRDVSKLGHKRMETTLRYSHLGETHLREAVERLTKKPTDTRTSTEQTSTSAQRVLKTA